MAVLVHGRAVATVRVDDGPEITLTASDSVLPVSRTFAGATVTVSLAVGAPGAPDPGSGSATAWCTAAASP